MFSKTWLAVFAALFVYVYAAEAAPPIEAYGRLPTLSDFRLSPDGSMVSYVRGHEGSRVIVIQSVGTQQPPMVLNIGDQKLRQLQWADNSRLLITTSVTTLPLGLVGRRGEFFMAQEYDVDSKSLHPFLQHVDSTANPAWSADAALRLNVVAGLPEIRSIDGDPVAFVRGIYFPEMGKQGRYALFRDDLIGGANRILSKEGDTHAENWVIDEAGKIVAEADYYESEQHWKLRVFHDGDPAKAVDAAAPIEGPDVEGIGEDGAAILVRLPPTEDWPSYEQVSLKDGSAGPWRHSDLHLYDLFHDPATGRVIGGPRFTDKNDYVFFDPHTDAVWRGIRAAFNDATNVGIVSWSQDWNKVVVLVFGPGYGDGYFYVDMTTHKADPIGDEYDDVTEVSQEKWIEYRAADGRVIHAYLTLPMNREPKNLPLVVLPHGGPDERDEPGFDWLSQALASRGYAVLQPEYRGSGEFGKELLWAGFGEFGRKMQTDLSDGMRAIATQGLIDPKRVCIVGNSLYGGYAALAGATLDTGVYRCAVSVAGVSDLRAQLSLWHFPHRELDDRNARYWDRFLGVSDLNDPKLDAISPIKHVDKVSIPILLIHGKDDTVVPIAQSEDMADALKAAGKQVEFVKLDGEDHWLSRSETRLQMLKATVKFLETNNPPDAAEASASK